VLRAQGKVQKGTAQERALKAKEGAVCVLEKGARKKYQSEGVLGAPKGTKKGPYSVPGGPREARGTEQCLIRVLKKGKNKKQGALPPPHKSQ
jgi:hypothetical protein